MNAVPAKAGAAAGRFPVAPRYQAYHDIGESPNLIVDGAPLKSTVLTLSHWPNNQTPEPLKRDTSTAIVFAYLENPAFHRFVPLVSNNHFDEDGLFSMFALCYPALAMEHRQLLEDASRAGDFGVFESREAARLSFVVEAFAAPGISPLPAPTFSGCERRQVAALYVQMLERLPDILADLSMYKACWQDQDEFLGESLDRVASGEIGIEEIPELDLATVEMPAALQVRTARRYLQPEQTPVHPFAIHSATSANRILRIQGQRFELQYRYESWVQLASRRPMLRVDLKPLADLLNAEEKAPGHWMAEAVTEVAPRLYLDGTAESSLERARFIDLVSEHLRTAPVAWDPYDWDGA